MDAPQHHCSIDEQISKLQQAKAILSGVGVKKPIGRPKTTHAASKAATFKPAKRVMSAEGRAKIAKAQKARWAKARKAAKKAANV